MSTLLEIIPIYIGASIILSLKSNKLKDDEVKKDIKNIENNFASPVIEAEFLR